jgi:hypothetical protein
VTPIDAPGALADAGAKEAMYVSLRLRLPPLHNSGHDWLPNLVPGGEPGGGCELEMLLGQVFLGTLIAGSSASWGLASRDDSRLS